MTWREAGAGPVLLLLHGIGGHSGSWRAQFAQLSDLYRVVAWDAPGYGGSSLLPSDHPSATDYTRQLRLLLAEIGVTSARAVGHSLGGVMMANLVRSQPALIERSIFLQTVTGGGRLDPDEREKVRQARIADLRALGMTKFAEMRGRTILSRRASPDAVREALKVMAAVPEAGYLAAWNMMCAADIESDLLHVTGPSLVICGRDDPVAPPAMGKQIQAALAESHYEELADVGHYASIEAPERLLLLLRSFIENSEPTRRPS
jgi:pimeloyl-ACP methyl ester carboxylesterase